MSLPCLPSSFSSIRATVWEEVEEFQDGRHGGLIGHRNETSLAILDLYVAPIPPI